MTYFQAPWYNHIIFHCSSITLKRRDIIVESRYVPVARRYILSNKWSVAKKFVVKISITVDTLKNKHKLIEHIFILFISENQEIFLSISKNLQGLKD